MGTAVASQSRRTEEGGQRGCCHQALSLRVLRETQEMPLERQASPGLQASGLFPRSGGKPRQEGLKQTRGTDVREVLVFACRHGAPQTRGLQPHEFAVPRFWRPEVQGRGFGGAVPREGRACCGLPPRLVGGGLHAHGGLPLPEPVLCPDASPFERVPVMLGALTPPFFT